MLLLATGRASRFLGFTLAGSPADELLSTYRRDQLQVRPSCTSCRHEKHGADSATLNYSSHWLAEKLFETCAADFRSPHRMLVGA